jgi:hypothetical protein
LRAKRANDLCKVLVTPPRPPRGPPGAPGGRFINTRAFTNRRSLVICLCVFDLLCLTRTRGHVGAPAVLPPPELLAKPHFCGPKREARPDFESSRRADSESGLRCPAHETRHFSMFRLALVLLGVVLQRCHERGLESSSRDSNHAKTLSKASPTHLEGFRRPNSDPKICDFLPPPPTPPPL